ncbi:MAG: F0F1 ATP synthase subunit B [Gammaproteobacteria bacterium]
MTVDWITVSAQIINFLVLVWLLKRFLYEPVIRAMDRREQRIAEQLQAAQEREQQALAQQQQYQDKAAQLDRQREELISKAQQQAEEEKRQLLDQAREEVNEKQKQWQGQAEQDKEEFLKILRKKSTEAIQAISRKALSDLANAELEEQVIASFITRLKSLDKDSRNALARAVAGASEPLRIHSAFELDSTTRARITRAVHEYIAEGIDTQYSGSPELLCGIELSGGGQRLSWNLADYLRELNTRVEDAFTSVQSKKET